MSFMFIDPFGYGTANEPATVEFLGYISSNTIPLGAEEAGRVIILSIPTVTGAGRQLTGATLNGVPGTILVERELEGPIASNYHSVYILLFELDSGTSGTLVPTWTGGVGATDYGVYKVMNLDSVTPVDTFETYHNITPLLSATLNVEKDGAVIVATTGRTATGGALTGSNVNLDYGVEYLSTLYRGYGSSEITADAAGYVVGFNVVSSTGQASGVTAAVSLK